MNLPLGPSKQPTEAKLVIEAWNMMSGKIDWAGLPIVAEILGITDIDTLTRQLVVLRDRGK